jgi:ketosteroid isomerase-like protein
MGAKLLLALAALLLTPGVARAQDDLARRTSQVEDLRSLREIKRLQAEFGYRLIAGDFKGMGELGTDYFELVLPDGNAEGRPAVEQWLRNRFGQGNEGIAAGRLNLHVWLSPVVTLSAMGDRATGRWRHLALTGEKGVTAEWRMTTEIIEYHKTQQGWRIAHIQPWLSFVGPYDGGWRHPATLQRPAFHFTPDEAGTVVPNRSATTVRPSDELARDATLLLHHGTAQNLANAYGYYLDRRMYDDIADLFAPAAQIDVAGQGVYNGADGVRKYLARFGAPGLDPGELNDRPQLMPLVSVSADGSMALVRVVELGMSGQHGGQGFWSAAINTFLLRPDPQGHWRIEMLHVRPLMRADYATGWATPLAAAPPIGESQFPDGPGQPVDTSYPDHPFAMQQLGAELIFAPRGEAQPLAVADHALERAEAFDAAENLAGAYGEYINQFAWPEMAAIFAEKGWRELPFIGVVAGRDKILEGAQMRYAATGLRTEFQAIHMLAQPYVTVSDDGERAQLRARLIQMNSSTTAPGSWLAGVYEDQLVKEGGVWRIAGMDLDYTWLANYQGGWTAADPGAANALRPSPELLARYRLDAPIRGDPGIPFPRIAALPFHYVNPVSGRAPERLIAWTEIPAKENR